MSTLPSLTMSALTNCSRQLRFARLRVRPDRARAPPVIDTDTVLPSSVPSQGSSVFQHSREPGSLDSRNPLTQYPSVPVFWNTSFPVIQISGAAPQSPGFHDAHREDSWVGSQLKTSTLLRMNASFCSAFIRPWYLRKKPLSPEHFASLPGVDNRGRSLSA